MRAAIAAASNGGVAVSLSRSGVVVAHVEDAASADLLALFERALKAADARRTEIREVAVDRGPGGFSTVRRRVAVGTGLARGLGAALAATGALSPEEAAALPSSAFSARAIVEPLYDGAPSITLSKKKKTWTAR